MQNQNQPEIGHPLGGNPESALEQNDSGDHLVDDIQRIIHEPRYWLMTVVLSAALSGIAGGAVYWYMRGQVDLVGTVLTQRIDELEGRLAQQTAAQNEPEDDADAADEEILTTDWKTYQNDEYGFEVKYPSDWFVYERRNGEKRVYIQTAPGEVDKQTAPADFRRIWIAYDSEESDENSPRLSGAIKSTATWNGITMNYYEWLSNIDTGEPKMEAYWTNSNGDRYMADCAIEVGAQDAEQEVEVLKQILSTFKFTDAMTQ